MPFRAIEDAEKRGVLTTALAEYCAEKGISSDTDEYEQMRELMIILYQNGHQTAAELKAALLAGITRAE